MPRLNINASEHQTDFTIHDHISTPQSTVFIQSLHTFTISLFLHGDKYEWRLKNEEMLAEAT